VRVAAHCIDADLGGLVAIQVLFSLGRIGGAKRDRTADLLVANEALSQLSYSPTRREQPSISLAAMRGIAEAPQGLRKRASSAWKRSSRWSLGI
jgi:hypothetical protein